MTHPFSRTAAARPPRLALAVADLGFGDAGKGTTIDALARRCAAPLVVRHHGGGQAGHRVVAPDGRAHVFAQFGAGTFAPGARTLLGPAFLLHPAAMLVEADLLRQRGVDRPFHTLAVHEDCRVTTPMQQAAGRLRELARGAARHGSCGMGIGETVADSLAAPPLRARDLGCRAALRARLLAHQRHKAEQLADAHRAAVAHARSARAADEALATVDALWRTLTRPDAVDEAAAWMLDWHDRVRRVDDDGARRWAADRDALLFEGAQGALLDQDLGLAPHVTWSDCTFGEARALLDTLQPETRLLRLGVTRAFATRHGAGPLPSERPELAARWPDAENHDGPWQGPFRAGDLDLVLLRSGLDVLGGVDGLVVTHLDRVPHDRPWPVVDAWDVPGPAGRERWHRLPPVAPDDLEAHARRTHSAAHAAPHALDPPPTGPEALLRLLVRALGAPVVGTSWGPRACDKRGLRDGLAALGSNLANR